MTVKIFCLDFFLNFKVDIFCSFLTIFLWFSNFFYPGGSNDHGFGRLFYILLSLEKSQQFLDLFWIFGLFFWIFSEFFPVFFSSFHHFFSIFFASFLWFSNLFYPEWSNDHGFGCIFHFLLGLKNVTKMFTFFKFFLEFLTFFFKFVYFLFSISLSIFLWFSNFCLSERSWY